ncbi:hypothetical protein Tco_1134369 [Tanacetum coccineum]
MVKGDDCLDGCVGDEGGVVSRGGVIFGVSRISLGEKPSGATEVEMVASFICCIHDSIPFTYLGLPIGRKMHLSEGWGEVKWDSILLSRNMDGLGVGSLFAKNLSLLSKWKWHFISKENALWRKVIKAFYGADGGLNLNPASFFGARSIWCEIIKAISSVQSIDSGFNNSFTLKVGFMIFGFWLGLCFLALYLSVPIWPCFPLYFLALVVA